MQQSAKISEIAVTLTSRGEAFGKEYDAIEFVCGKSFGKGVGVRHVDDSETVIAVYGAFSFRYHHMVWHLLINLAAICHFTAIVFYLY